MSRIKNIKCWGLVSVNDTTEITIQKKCKSIKEFKEICKSENIVLTSKPYFS